MLILLFTVPAAAVYSKQIPFNRKFPSSFKNEMYCAKSLCNWWNQNLISPIPKAEIFQSMQDNVLPFGAEWLKIIHQTIQ